MSREYSNEQKLFITPEYEKSSSKSVMIKFKMFKQKPPPKRTIYNIYKKLISN